jgi:TRAP-type C4-dicarboxylate transport system permease small subunit
VTFLLHRLPRRVREAVLVTFNVVALAFALVILWQATALTINSRSLNATAPTLLMTPLWIPQLLMPIGMAATSVTLARLLRRRLARVQERA